MPNRAARRAAERLAKEQQPLQQTAAAAEPTIKPVTAPTPQPTSDAQLAANRANAQLSSGPKSPAGKAASSLNAVKTALTGRTILLHSDDVAEYQRHIAAYQEEFKPIGYLESELLQSIADCAWRIRRVSNLEQTFYAKGREEFADLFPKADPAHRPSLIELHTYETYNKQFRNLQLQESRLARRREKEIAELRRLQQQRVQKHQEALQDAARVYLAAQHDGQPFVHPQNGFVFSTAEIQAFLEDLRTNRIAYQAVLNTYNRPNAASAAA
jgi:hypothetical protein